MQSQILELKEQSQSLVLSKESSNLSSYYRGHGRQDVEEANPSSGRTIFDGIPLCISGFLQKA